MQLVRADEMQLLLKERECVCLYGAGILCEYIVERISQLGMLDKVDKIFVTKARNRYEEVWGILVTEFQKEKIRDGIPIIIAVSAKYQGEIKKLLEECGHNDIVMLLPEFEADIKCKVIERRAELEKKKIDHLRRRIGEVIRNSRAGDEDILFFSPPYWDVYSPFSAVPCLVAKLKEDGYKAGQVDLGIHCIWHAISKNWRMAAKRCLTEDFFRSKVFPYVENPYESYEEYLSDMWFFYGSSFDVSEIKKRYNDLNCIQRGVIGEFYDNIYRMDLVEIDFNKCENLHQEIEESLSLNYMETLCSDRILQEFAKLPSIIGISITSTRQFLPGCVLAKIIKENNPNIKIVFGGSCADLFANSSYKDKMDIMQYFDYIIVGEGETALSRLLSFIKGNGELEAIPNLMLFDDKNQIYYTGQMVEDVLALPAPDYDGLDLNLYLAPKLILPYQTSRGCHYGYCAFCNHDEKYRHNYRSKLMKKAVGELIFLSDKYHTHCFQFVDEAIRPDCFKEMIEEMDQHPECKKMKWIYYSRVSFEYNEELLVKAKRNGCEMVMFGVETFNQRLLNFIKKGISADASRYCLSLFKKCGIKTYAWMLCNLPSETIEEAREDYEEIIRQIKNIDAFTIGAFYLSPNTDMYKEPSKYNITLVNKEKGTHFMSHYEGVQIDKEEMMCFYREKCLALQNKWCFTGNRYILFFNDL